MVAAAPAVWTRALAALAVFTVAVVSPLIAPDIAPAQAAPTDCNNTDPLGVAGQFTEFIHTTAQRVSDSEGRVAYGGDAQLGDSTARVGFSASSGPPVDAVGPVLGPDPTRHDLIVGGTLTAYQVTVGNGAARYGSLAPGSTPLQSLGPATAGPPTQRTTDPTPIDFDAEFSALAQRSQSWADLAPTGAITGSTTLDLTGTAPGLNVFRLTAAMLEQARAIRIRVPAGATTLVSIIGTDINLNRGPLATVSIWDPVTQAYIVDDHFINGAPIPSPDWLRLRQSLLWNFPTATHILKNYVALPGTVLAPQAAFEFGRGPSVGPGHIDGGLIARSVTSAVGAETHALPFVGPCLPETTEFGSLELRKQLTGPLDGAPESVTVHLDCDGEQYDQDVAITIASGQRTGTTTVSDLPAGLACTITEPSPPTGWQLVGITPSNFVIANATTVVVNATNDRQLGEIRLVKRIDGQPLNTAWSFDLTLDCTGTEWDRTVAVEVAAGTQQGAAMVDGLPSGLSCQVGEPSLPDGWQLVGITPSEVTVGSGGPVEVVVTNTAGDTAIQPPPPPPGGGGGSGGGGGAINNPPPISDPTLPATGTASRVTAGVGVLLIGLGVMLLAGSRRTRVKP